MKKSFKTKQSRLFTVVWGYLLAIAILWGGIYIGYFHAVQSVGEAEMGLVVPTLFLGGLLLILTTLNFLVYINHKVVIDEDTMEVISSLGFSSKVQWQDIREVRFNPMISPNAKVIDKNGRKLKISSRAFSEFREILFLLECRMG